jgi:hypothetical protein
MPVTINGTTGVVTPGATIGSINGILKSSSGVVSQAVAGTDYLTPTSGGSITLDTAQTASGTAVDFTGIPSWVKRITVMMNGVSTSGSSDVIIQIGSGSFSTSGYSSFGGFISSSGTNIATSSIGFLFNIAPSSPRICTGISTICNVNSNNWIQSALSSIATSHAMNCSGSAPALSGALDRIRITMANGTDTFDAGTINISYE